MDELPPIVTNAYDLALWLFPRINDFPRSYRFVPGSYLPLPFVRGGWEG
jgi:hypothetical protein